jgi:chromosome segregation ATPase
VYQSQQIIDYDKFRLGKDSLQSLLEDARNRLQYERSSYSALEKNIRDLSDRLEQKKKLCKDLKAKAESQCRREDVELQLDLDNLTDQLSRLEARLNQLAIIDPSIQKRYSEAEKKAQETKKELDNISSRHEDMKQEISERFTRWKQNMAKEVDKMNSAFRNLMETCGYRGEVHLAYDDEAKLDTYKLNLMVAFNRQSTLSILSSTRQSGGEKSVTTLMFLLALQDCTQFPFRVVDEINQGMDEVNDRNSFVQVMGYAMRKNQSSQYFLVTPKLLPNLEQMDGITVMVVMNGPYVSDQLNKPITFESGAPDQPVEEE